MRFITVRSIFTSLLVASSVAILGLSNEVSPRQLPTTEEYVIPLIAVDGKKYFVLTGSACGNGYINCYQSLDGVQVCRSGGAYTQSIKSILEDLLKEAIVIERGPMLDDAGQVPGERVVIVYQKKETGRQAAAICWWNGEGYSIINGDSLEHVINFERQNER